MSYNVLFRAGVCLYSRCGQSYFNIKWRSNNWRRERQRKYRWVKLFVNDTLFLIGCIIKVTLRSVVSLISYGPMELKYNNYLNTGNCICKMLVCVNGKSCLATLKNTSDASQFCQTSLSNDRLDCYLISVPSPVEDLPFLVAPEDWIKLHSPLKTAIKYGFGPEESNMGVLLNNSEKI